MANIFFTAIIVVLQLSTTQSITTKQVQSKNVEPVGIKGLREILGYPNAALVPSAHTNDFDHKKGFFMMILRTQDPVSKVADFYEKQIFFPREGPFLAYLHLHPITGHFYDNDAHYSMFYQRDNQEDMRHYLITMDKGNLDSVTITRIDDSTTIIIQHVVNISRIEKSKN